MNLPGLPSARAAERLTVLLTGFGPFPGAPRNPTGALVAKLVRRRRPALAGITLVGHVFPTSYAAVDRELPDLLARAAPDILLMFGLAARRRELSIETRARNAVSLLPDAARSSRRIRSIVAGDPAVLAFGPHTRRLVSASRMRGIGADLSHDAGRYVCNYLCWRALEATGRGNPRLAAFVHVPKLRAAVPLSRGRRHRLTLDDLVRGGEAILVALVAAARTQR